MMKLNSSWLYLAQCLVRESHYEQTDYFPMRNFIEDYLMNPTAAIASATEETSACEWMNTISEDTIYSQISSPEFRLLSTYLLWD